MHNLLKRKRLARVAHAKGKGLEGNGRSEKKQRNRTETTRQKLKENKGEVEVTRSRSNREARRIVAAQKGPGRGAMDQEKGPRGNGQGPRSEGPRIKGSRDHGAQGPRYPGTEGPCQGPVPWTKGPGTKEEQGGSKEGRSKVEVQAFSWE